jgi:hypothetical protein
MAGSTASTMMSVDDYLAEPHKFSRIQIPGPAQVFTFIDEHPESITAGIW